MTTNGVDRVTGIPLVFHFTGNDVPRWGAVTLRHAKTRWPGQVFLLTDRDKLPSFPGVSCVPTEGWYDPEPFRDFATTFARPNSFRGGFWYHAVERFFVLQQWASHFEIERFIHTELDVVLFGGEKLSHSLAKLTKGVFFPRASASNAGANFLYVNELKGLTKLVEFFQANSGQEYEMGLLARFLDEHPELSGSLPSHFNFESDFSSDAGKNCIPLKVFQGVIDVHPIGTWIFGQDPRNEPGGMVFNHYFYQGIGTPEVSDLKFRYSFKQRQLLVRVRDLPEWPVHALHVHSKVMRRAHNPILLATYAWLANRSARTVIAVQHLHKYPLRGYIRLRDWVYLRLFVPLRNRSPISNGTKPDRSNTQ